LSITPSSTGKGVSAVTKSGWKNPCSSSLELIEQLIERVYELGTIVIHPMINGITHDLGGEKCPITQRAPYKNSNS
jgi:hypothetical protein